MILQQVPQDFDEFEEEVEGWYLQYAIIIQNWRKKISFEKKESKKLQNSCEYKAAKNVLFEIKVTRRKEKKLVRSMRLIIL